MRERTGFEIDVAPVTWMWFECAECGRLRGPLPITPGIALLVTGLLP